MDNQSPNKQCFSLQSLPSHIKSRYKRLALITGKHHLEQLLPSDDDTLIVSCDWLLWQEAMGSGLHCVYYELGISEWTEPDNLDSDLMIKANEWVYETGADLTLFRGVSLGMQFNGPMLFCLINYLRLERSILKLIERFQPEEIMFYDFANDINVLGRILRCDIVKSIVQEQGLQFTDRSNPKEQDAFRISENLLDFRKKQNIPRKALLHLYIRILSAITALRSGFLRKPSILLLLGVNSTGPLINNFHDRPFVPIIQAQTVPKTLQSLWRCIASGIRLVALKDVPLNEDDKVLLVRIRLDLSEVLLKPAIGRKAFINRFVMTHFLESGKFEAIAQDVRQAEALMDTYHPNRIVVDGVRNPPPRVFVELAHSRGIPIDYYWHSPMNPQYLKFDALGGDPNIPHTVTRCLTWGTTNDTWLDLVHSHQPRIRVGSPQIDRYHNWKEAQPSKHQLLPTKTNVLVLQYAPINTDLKSLNTNLYSFFVDMMRGLQNLEFINVRYKLHPGPGRWKKSYFQDIACYFNFSCKILKKEPFDECVDWADVVIGPIQTGAFFETLAAGKPYLAILIPPHSYEISCYKNYPVMSSVSEICHALQSTQIMTEGKKIGLTLLEDVYSIKEFPSSCTRFWDVLEDDFQDSQL